VAHAASDIKAIADGLGIASFAVIGISGGGPHALAAAAGLPDRVTRCATIVGLSWGFDVAAIASPTVVMIAREDTTVPRGHGVWIAGHVTGAVRVKVDGGHFGPRVEPEERLLGWAGGADIEVAG
jgi:pimeloyl-ACP methyl ester carboxylesterase